MFIYLYISLRVDQAWGPDKALGQKAMIFVNSPSLQGKHPEFRKVTHFREPTRESALLVWLLLTRHKSFVAKSGRSLAWNVRAKIWPILAERKLAVG